MYCFSPPSHLLYVVFFHMSSRPTTISGTRSSDQVINDKQGENASSASGFPLEKLRDIQLGNSPIVIERERVECTIVPSDRSTFFCDIYVLYSFVIGREL